MKNFFLAIATFILIALLGTAIYIYNNPKVIEKITSQDKKDKTKSVDEEKDTSTQDDNTYTYPEQTEEGTNELSNTQQQTEERDSEGLTQEDRDKIATEQAKEYAKKHPEGQENNKSKMGPGPEDPDYQPDPRFTEGTEESAKDSSHGVQTEPSQGGYIDNGEWKPAKPE